MAVLLLAASSILILWLISTLLSLHKNWQLAKSTGLPILISPVDSHNLPWMMFQKQLTPILSKLPFGLGNWVHYNNREWTFHDKNRVHESIGKLFMHVTPQGNELYVADAAVSDQIFSRRKVFLKPVEIAQAVNLFGTSVATVEGEDWQRQRKITAPPFNERNSGLVWEESMKQAKEMLEHYGSSALTTIGDDTARLALHVLTGAGFGMSSQFRGAFDNLKEGFQFSFRDALDSVMQNILLYVSTPGFIFNLPFAPKKLVKVKRAVDDFKRYLVEMVDVAKEKALLGASTHPDLLNTLVEKSQEAKLEFGAKHQAENSLTDDEMYGNLFIFSFAGHETTANVLEYTIHLLAANPKYQEWIFEELEEVFEGKSGIEELNYEELYPRLKRCLSLMYETLRIYGPLLTVAKCTGAAPGIIHYEGREVTVPPHTKIAANVQALGTSKEYWGSDSFEWKPTRWMSSTEVKATSLENEQMVTPTKGSYIPWADGPRICPGKKFSMVEFVAVVSVLLWRHRIEILGNEGESEKQARKRVNGVVEDSCVKMTLCIKQPEGVRLRFMER